MAAFDNSRRTPLAAVARPVPQPQTTTSGRAIRLAQAAFSCRPIGRLEQKRIQRPLIGACQNHRVNAVAGNCNGHDSGMYSARTLRVDMVAVFGGCCIIDAASVCCLSFCASLPSFGVSRFSFICFC